ncbi:MAG TPA: hypothetical protein VGC58_01755 [Candidatus Paceibacterota bacterium]
MARSIKLAESVIRGAESGYFSTRSEAEVLLRHFKPAGEFPVDVLRLLEQAFSGAPASTAQTAAQ